MTFSDDPRSWSPRLAEMDVEPDPLLEALTGSREGPSVVAIGGGHGLAQVLGAVQRYAGDITAVVGVADDGGSSGRLAPAVAIPPPGDIRRCLIALTPDESIWRDLFDYRFADGDVDGHSLGNLLLVALADREGGFEQALRASERLLGTVGSVVPAANDRLQLEAVIDDERVVGQVNIMQRAGHLSELVLNPPGAEPTERALEAIAGADQIILGPGSLYTSILATLLVPGITEAINQARGTLVYVLNLCTQDAETLGMDAAAHLEALLKISGIRAPNVAVANTAPVRVEPPVEPLRIDPSVLETYGVDTVSGNLVDPAADHPRHDTARLGGVLSRLVSL